ncbi:MAG: diaminopimelate epimerase [Acidobacteriota bacterium]
MTHYNAFEPARKEVNLLTLHKLHGLGNDFLVFELAQPAATAFLKRPEVFVPKLCHRHQGIGGDGVIGLEALTSADADYRMMLWNADGSRAEMSGNGLRCLAAYLWRVMNCDKPVLRVMTDVGVRIISFLSANGLEIRCTLQMGVPTFVPEQIPFRSNLPVQVPLVDVALENGPEIATVTVLSMGNPHCTLFVSDLNAAPVEKLGPWLERHPAFPKRTNVEFVQVLDRRTLAARFWERGVGQTLSSGTGACAAAVAAMLKHLVDHQVTVKTAEGCLDVVWEGGNKEVFLTGSVHYIGQVVWGLPD